MTALNKQALRQLATDAHELGIIKRYTKGIEANKRFVAIATPLTMLALLDEMETKEEQRANWFQMAQKLGEDLDAAEKRIAEHNFENRLLANADRDIKALRQRIAELEAREVKLPPTFWYEHDDLPREIPVLSRRLVINALREAGVKIAAGIGVKGD